MTPIKLAVPALAFAFALLGAGSAAQAEATPGPVPSKEFGGACGVIPLGGTLASGQHIKSCDGRFKLELQTDGNLVVSAGATPLWTSKTNLAPHTTPCSDPVLPQACKIAKFLLAGEKGTSASFTSNGDFQVAGNSYICPNSADLNSCLVAASNVKLFDSNTAGKGAKLLLQNDGNLVVYTAAGQAVFATNTGGH